MSSPLKTHADLAARLSLPLSTVVELRKKEKWPHERFGRAVRFTDEQIEQIIATHTTVDETKAPDMFAGQTKRSARRSA